MFNKVFQQSNILVAPKCDKKCSGNNASYSSDKKKAVSSYGFSSVDDIK
jgi:hypothetical protein